MKESQKIGVPVGFWNKEEPSLLLKIKDEIEQEFSHYSVGVFSIQTSFSLKETKFNLQIEYSKEIPVVHVQAPIEHENSIVNYGEDLELALELTTHFRKDQDCRVNYHVGVTLQNQAEVDSFGKSKEQIWQKCVTNLQKLADFADEINLSITLENEPSVFVKPTGKDSIIRPVFFPFGNVHVLQKLIAEADRDNIALAFDSAHWAVSQLAPEMFRDKELVEKYFPGEDLISMLLKSSNCSSLDEYFSLQGEFSSCVEAAQVYHLSNTTGIGVHLPTEDEKYWGEDGTFQGYLSKEDLTYILNYAREHDRIAVIEVKLDLENKTFQEVQSFLHWLKTSNP